MATVAERIDKAAEAKARGNEQVAAGRFKQACFEYKHVHLFLSELGSKAGEHSRMLSESGVGAGSDGAVDMFKKGPGTKPTAEEQLAIDGLIASANANLALGHLRLQRHRQAAQAASVALLYDAAHPRALFRRASARLALGQTDEARVDCELVLALAPADPAAVALLRDIAEKERAVRAKEKKAYANLFA